MNYKRILLAAVTLLINIAIAAKNPEIVFIERLIDGGLYKEAAVRLRPLADGGDVDAQILAGDMFVQGLGVIESLEQAKKYYLMAAKQGSEKAHVRMFIVSMETGEFQEFQELGENYLKTLGKEDVSTVGRMLGELYLYRFDKENDYHFFERGWPLVVKHNEADKIEFPDGKIFTRNSIEEIGRILFPKLISSCIHQPDTLAEIMGNRCWSIHAEGYVPLMLDEIKKHPLAEQKQHLYAWLRLNERVCNYPTFVVSRFMCSEGFGQENATAQQIKSARESMREVCYDDISDFENLSALKFIVETKFVQGEVIEGHGAIESIDAEGAYIMSGGEKVTPSQLIPAIMEASSGCNDTYSSLTEIDRAPEFCEGTGKELQWISKNVKYPVACLEQGIGGRVVVSFGVSKKGEIVNVEVFRGCHPALDREAVRVVKSMPNWSPGGKNGHPVAVKKMVIPVTFKIK